MKQTTKDFILASLVIITVIVLTACSGGSSGSKASHPDSIPVTIGLDVNLQSFAFTDQYVYVLDRTYKVSRYDLEGNFIDTGTNLVGHQGLAYDGDLWSTDHYNKNSAMQFNYQGDVIGVYLLFGSEFSSISSATPTVTDNYLMAFGYRDRAPVVRVWYKDFAGSGDYSDKYIYEFEGVDTGPLQGIASDEVNIWVVTGGGRGDRHLYTFTIDGQLITKEMIIDESEPEGLDYHSGLFIGMYDHGTGTADIKRHR